MKCERQGNVSYIQYGFGNDSSRRLKCGSHGVTSSERMEGCSIIGSASIMGQSNSFKSEVVFEHY